MLDPIMREIDSMLVLQVHDELVFDVTDSEYQSLIPDSLKLWKAPFPCKVPPLLMLNRGPVGEKC